MQPALAASASSAVWLAGERVTAWPWARADLKVGPTVEAAATAVSNADQRPDAQSRAPAPNDRSLYPMYIRRDRVV